jgi:HPt (histidine-containing phosphotransfer) domain-containing protein
MDDFISKPIEFSELRRVLARFAPRATQAHLGAPIMPPSDLSGLPIFEVPMTAGFDYAGALQAADQEVVDIIAHVFQAQWPVDHARMQAALTADDLSPVLHAAHSLKGTLGLFGAQPAVNLARQLEDVLNRATLDGPHGLLADAEALIARLNAEVDQLVLALQTRETTS